MPGDRSRIPGNGNAPRIFHVLGGEALRVRTTPYGLVGTIFADPALEIVWVTKQAEEVDPGWFSQPTTDILFVAQDSRPAEGHRRSGPRSLAAMGLAVNPGQQEGDAQARRVPDLICGRAA